MAKKKSYRLSDPVQFFRAFINATYRRDTYFEYFSLRRKVRKDAKTLDKLAEEAKINNILIRKNLEKYCDLPPSGD